MGSTPSKGEPSLGGYNSMEKTALQAFHTWEEVRYFSSEMPTTWHGIHVELWMGGFEPN